MTLLTSTTIVGSSGAIVDSLAIILMMRAVRAPSVLICSSYAVVQTLDTKKILVIRDGNNKAIVMCFFVAHSQFISL